MAVVIGEVITETVLGKRASGQADDAAAAPLDDVVRQATERVMEILRREWDR